jgi:SAM-dependent methyltransferase
MSTSPKESMKTAVRAALPLFIRKRLAVWLNSQERVAAARRSWWVQELLRDLAEKNINEYHKFLWSNHLSYAETYDVPSRFGRENMKGSRVLFFADLKQHLASVSLFPADVKSVFEVGCSLGYQLRSLETDLFPSATILDGVDIDAYAIQAGSEYLAGIGSKVRLTCQDMELLEKSLGSRQYDIILCTGVLMYLKEEDARRLVAVLLRHTRRMAAFSGLALPERDNAEMGSSIPRESDHSFIHNIDSMVKDADGRIVARRWEGDRVVDGNTIYFVFATSAAEKK